MKQQTVRTYRQGDVSDIDDLENYMNDTIAEGWYVKSVTAIRQVQGCTPGVVVVYERDTDNEND